MCSWRASGAFRANSREATLEQAMPILTVYPHAFGGLAANSVYSALELAIMDIRGKAAGKPGARAPRQEAARQGARVCEREPLHHRSIRQRLLRDTDAR